MAHASVVDLNSDLVSLGRSNFNVFDGKFLAGLPGYGSLASNGLLLDITVNCSGFKMRTMWWWGLWRGDFVACVLELGAVTHLSNSVGHFEYRKVRVDECR